MNYSSSITDGVSSNIMVIGLQELISEVQVFAEKTGLGTETAENFIGDMFGPVAKSYSQRFVPSARVLNYLSGANDTLQD